MTRRALVLGLFLLSNAAAEAGPWATGKGHSYTKVGLGHLRSRTLVAPDGTAFDIPRFTKTEVGLYASYGLDDRFTAVLNLPAFRRSDLEGFGAEAGVGDVMLGLQMQLGRRGPWVFATRASVQLPTGDAERAEGLLPTGSGVHEGEVLLGAGRSLAGGKGYMFAEAGPVFRGGTLRDAFGYAAQVGWNVRPRLTVALNVRGVEPFSHKTRDVALGSPVGLSDRVTYLNYGPTVILGLRHGVSLQADVDQSARARNLARGLTYRLGVAYSR
jgi:hypothetical protein